MLRTGDSSGPLVTMPCLLLPCKCLLDSRLPTKAWNQSAGSDKCNVSKQSHETIFERDNHWTLAHIPNGNTPFIWDSGWIYIQGKAQSPSQRTTCDSLLLGMLQASLPGMKSTSPCLVQVFSVLLDGSTQLGFASLFHCGALPNETGLGHCQSHRQREELQVRGCG